MSTLPEAIRQKQFLVTDDYESMRLMIGENLKQLGVQKILFAESGNKAFKILKENLGKPQQIDILLTDMIMEDGNGVELVKAVRADPALKDIPILMITSKAEVGLIIDAVKAGVTSYIIKPWQLDDLAKKITDAMAKAKPRS
jgi:two-component system, chemotaxis family, chemotaxis protein CheY